MPITLPNSGLVCPEAGDPQSQACDQIKALFTYVDGLPTDDDDDNIENPCVVLPSTSWSIIGDPSNKVFKQTLTVPTTVTATKTSMSILDSNNCVANLEIEVVSVNTICVFTNSPETYTIIFG